MNFKDELRHFFGGRSSYYEDDYKKTEPKISDESDQPYSTGYNEAQLSINSAILETILYLRNMDMDDLFAKKEKNLMIYGDYLNDDFTSARNVYVFGDFHNNGFCAAENVSCINKFRTVEELKEFFGTTVGGVSWTYNPDKLDLYTEQGDEELMTFYVGFFFEFIDNLKDCEGIKKYDFLRKVLKESEELKNKSKKYNAQNNYRNIDIFL